MGGLWRRQLEAAETPRDLRSAGGVKTSTVTGLAPAGLEGLAEVLAFCGLPGVRVSGIAAFGLVDSQVWRRH